MKLATIRGDILVAPKSWQTHMVAAETGGDWCVWEIQVDMGKFSSGAHVATSCASRALECLGSLPQHPPGILVMANFNHESPSLKVSHPAHFHLQLMVCRIRQLLAL